MIKALACGNEASGLNSSVQQKQPNLHVCYMVDVLPRYRVTMVTKRDHVSTIKKWTDTTEQKMSVQRGAIQDPWKGIFTRLIVKGKVYEKMSVGCELKE